MADSKSFSSAGISAAILRGVDVGIKRIAIRLGATIGKMLSMPGRGRVYIRDRKSVV